MTELYELLWNHAVDNEDWAEADRLEELARVGSDPIRQHEDTPILSFGFDAAWYGVTSGKLQTPTTNQNRPHTLAAIAGAIAREGWLVNYTEPGRVGVSSEISWMGLTGYVYADMVGSTALIDTMVLADKAGERLRVGMTERSVIDINGQICMLKTEGEAAQARALVVRSTQELIEQI